MILRLFVSNYRCFESFELRLAGTPSALLIGKNGTGKSTVAASLEVLQSIARGMSRVGDVVKPGEFYRGRSDVPIRFELDAAIGGKAYAYSLALELPDKFKELRVLEEQLTVDGEPCYRRKESDTLLSKVGRNAESRFGIDWHLIALPIIQEQSVSDPLYIFRTWLGRMLILAPVPSLMLGESTGEALHPDRRLVDFGAWFSGLLTHSPAAYSLVDKFLRSVMPDFKEIKNPPTGSESRSLSVQFQVDQASISLPFRVLSDGEKCFLICAVTLAANEAYGPIVCFWDEPDNYLAPSEVGQFIMALRRTVQEGGQLIVTSHNIEAIRHFTDDDTFVLYRKSHVEPTLVRPLSDIQVNGDLGEAILRDEINP